MRRFNTAGPCEPDRHYMVPALGRLPDARALVDQFGYFVVHAPRQTGKTTTLRALAAELTESGAYAGLYFSVESARAHTAVQLAEAYLIDAVARAAELRLPPELRPPAVPAATVPDGPRLSMWWTKWAIQCPRPIALVIDEVDALEAPVLETLLAQLRGQYADRRNAASDAPRPVGFETADSPSGRTIRVMRA